MPKYNSPLHKMTQTTDTDYWNDSCSLSELKYAIERGAVGATTNPSIVYNVLKKDFHLWEHRIIRIIKDNPKFDEDEIAWKLIQEMAVKGSELLYPVFKKENEKKGWISIQVNAKFYRNEKKMIDQAVDFSRLAPNMQVKLPATAAGIKAIEESTYLGVNIAATVCFTVPQAIAVGEAVERGLTRRENEGKGISNMVPVCAMMVGRLDDWLKIVADKENIIINPAYPDLAGVAVLKKTVQIYREKGFRTKMLVAAYRSQLHWSELIGGNIIHTIPYKWQLRYNGSDVKIENTTDKPMDPKIIEELSNKFEDFRKAYDPQGIVPEDFERYGSTKQTLKGFLGAYSQLVDIIRDLMIPGI